MSPMPGMDIDAANHCYIERATGRLVPAECIDEYAREQLLKAVEKLASAWLGSEARSPQNG